MLWGLRALVWGATSAGLLLAGFALFAAALVAPGVIAHGAMPPELQRQALGSLYSSVVMQALLPELGITLAVWLALARGFPSLDRSWRALLLATPAVAAIGFPTVGHYLFTMWQPNGASDYLATWILLTLAISAALLIPRAASVRLGPGSFTVTPKRGIVKER